MGVNSEGGSLLSRRSVLVGGAAAGLFGCAKHPPLGWRSSLGSKSIANIAGGCSVKPIGGLFRQGCLNSISSGPDEGAVSTMAGMFHKPKRHSNYQECAANILPCRELYGLQFCGDYESSIGGHGNYGYFEVGAGQRPNGSSDNWVGLGNLEKWLPFFQPPEGGGKMGRIAIYACYTGAGFEGAQLVWELAQITKRQVLAPTGLVWWSNCYVMKAQPGVKWQFADPEMIKPREPMYPPAIEVNPFDVAKLLITPTESLVDEDMESVSVTRYTPGLEPRTENFSPREAGMLLGAAMGSQANIDGDVSALITADMTFNYRSAPPLHIQVYGDRLAETSLGRARAHCSPALKKHLDTMFP